jgi:hypothetical protein
VIFPEGIWDSGGPRAPKHHFSEFCKEPGAKHPFSKLCKEPGSEVDGRTVLGRLKLKPEIGPSPPLSQDRNGVFTLLLALLLRLST